MRALKSLVIEQHLRFAGILMIFLVFVTGSVFAQDKRTPLEDRFKPQPQQGSEAAPPPNVIVAPNEDYRVGPGDYLEIRVEDAPELLTRTRVNTKGTILMPYLQYVAVRGKTTEEITNYVTEKLRGKYLKNPHVSVAITQVNSHSYVIQGAVRRPGPFQIEGRTSLMRLISYSGGLLDNHGSRAYVIREAKNPIKVDGANGSPGQEPSAQQSTTEAVEVIKYEMLASNISALYKGRFDQDVILEPGDVVNIPPTDVFFVAGEVIAPGEFPLKEGTTLRQAIAMAQNVTGKAQAKNAVIFREDVNGERKEIPVDITAIMDNKKPDVQLMANDIVIVPNSKLKSALLPILNAFGSGASFAVGGRVIR
jgi:polysaccharide biosynthesis/export protein